MKRFAESRSGTPSTLLALLELAPVVDRKESYALTDGLRPKRLALLTAVFPTANPGT
jgi:hypothetical protein